MRITLALCAIFLLAALAAEAKSLEIPEAARVQAQAFGLGYVLRTADLRALAYTHSVEALQGTIDPQTAGAEVAHLSSDVVGLRRAQAASYTQAAALLNQMGAPLSLRDWASHTAALLNAPLIETTSAKKLAKTEPGTAVVLAELNEIRAVKSAADAQQTPLTLWLELISGKIGPWTADVGAYSAALYHDSAAVTPSRLPSIMAQTLLRHAPPDAPAVTRESLATLIPTGGGNLQNLATAATANVTSQKITHVYKTLLAIYHAETLAESEDKDAS